MQVSQTYKKILSLTNNLEMVARTTMRHTSYLPVEKKLRHLTVVIPNRKWEKLSFWWECNFGVIALQAE